MTPQPTERHIQIGLECSKRWIDEGGTVGEIVAQVLAEHFPNPQPTTERPTETGNYWFYDENGEDWDMVEVVNIHYRCGDFREEHLSARFAGIGVGRRVDQMTGEWLRIDPPASRDVKGEAS